MKMHPVTSSNLKAVGYDPETKTLRVQFSSGGSYDYPGVDPELHEQFLAADSVGKFFHSRIRGRNGVPSPKEKDDE